jgi:murein DD-endopeptidase MepM/ murein hydrolase activator NlpD
LLRVVGFTALAAALWLIAAGQMPSPVRLPVGAVVAGATVSQPFGCTTLTLEPFDPFCPGRHVHTGIDLAAPVGTDVHSATGGTAHLGFDPMTAGLYVVVNLDSHTRLLYCHLSAFRVGDGGAVTSGQVIGLVGATGMATGPHVHFEIQVDGRSVDPARWLAS